MTLGGTSAGTFTLSYGGTPSPAGSLSRVDEVQTLALGGTSGGDFTLSLQRHTWTTLSRVDEVQMMTLSGTSQGTFTLSYNGTPSPAGTLSRVDEVQTVTLGGTSGTFTFSYNGTPSPSGALAVTPAGNEIQELNLTGCTTGEAMLFTYNGD